MRGQAIIREPTMNESRETLLKRLEDAARQVRRNVWRALKAGGSGHAGGSSSAADVLAALYFHRMRVRPAEPDWPERDRFVLSKGHANAALGAVLACFAAASFLVRVFLPGLVKRFSPERLLAWSFYMGAAGLVMMAFFGDARMLAVTAFVFGLGMGVGTPISVMLMFSQSAQGRSGQALGLRLTTNNLLRVAGPVMFGALGTAFGLAPIFWLIAVMLGSGGIVAGSMPRTK